MKRDKKSIGFFLIIFTAILASVIGFRAEVNRTKLEHSANASLEDKIAQYFNEGKYAEPEIIVPEIVKPEAPEYVRGIYLTAYSANRADWRPGIIEKMKNGRINAVIIDIKDYTGKILYDSKVEKVIEYGTANPIIKNLEEVLKEFEDAGIYTIARLTAFEDPALARANPELAIKTWNGNTWYNYKKLAWTDPGNKEVWEYNIAIAREAAELGFDEINFDYMRYPSDGNLKNIKYNIPEGSTRADTLEEFFAYISEEIGETVNTSIDMFGMVMDYADGEYDLGIGQRLDQAVDYFDYVCPMMYPHHYPDGYLGIAKPAVSPGPVVAYGLKKAAPTSEGKKASIRPWLQAFSLGADYTGYRINEQTIVTEKATSTSGWLLWNARNFYPNIVFKEI